MKVERVAEVPDCTAREGSHSNFGQILSFEAVSSTGHKSNQVQTNVLVPFKMIKMAKKTPQQSSKSGQKTGCMYFLMYKEGTSVRALGLASSGKTVCQSHFVEMHACKLKAMSMRIKLNIQTETYCQHKSLPGRNQLPAEFNATVAKARIKLY